MSEDNKKAKYKIIWIGILIVIGVIITFYGYRKYRIRQADLAKQAYIEQMRGDFEKYVPEKLPKYCTDLPYPGEVTATAKSSWEDTVYKSPSGSTHWYQWQDSMAVTLNVDVSFDELSEREIYNMLEKFSDCVWSAYGKVKTEHFPDYNKGEYSHIWEIDCYDLPVNRRSIDASIYIKTQYNTYERANHLKDYYIQNDRDHFIRDEKSQWASPTPAPESEKTSTDTPKKGSSSSKKSRTDPYEAHLYSDPDEYAVDYAEEFADELGEDEDEGYWEAYDHWVFWHEMND